MNLAIEDAARFALVFARVSGVLAVAPLTFGEAPMRARAVLALFLTLIVGPAVSSSHVPTTEEAITYAPEEVLFGIALGMVPRFVLSATLMVGELLTPMFGLNASMLFGASSTEPESALARFVRLFASLIAVSLGLHRVVIAALLHSFDAVPPGAVSHIAMAMGPLSQVAEQVIFLGFRLSMPLVAVHLGIQAALAYVSRAAPSMQIFSIGFGVAIVTEAFTMLAVLPDDAHEWSRALGDVGPAMDRVIGSLQ